MKWSEGQLCLTLCDPMDYTVPGILQARILEWAAFPFSRWSSQPRDQTQVPHIAGEFFTSWATREAQDQCKNVLHFRALWLIFVLCNLNKVIFLILNLHTISLGHPCAPAPSILYPASNLDWRFISYRILYMFQCHSPKSSHPLPLTQSPKEMATHSSILAWRIPGTEEPVGLPSLG